MLSSMTPTILAKDGKLFMVTGSPGGRTIINTVLHTILNVVDFKMSAQDAVDAGRFHHQWLPDRVTYERNALSPDTLGILKGMGHAMQEGGSQGVAEVIIDRGADGLEGEFDRRRPTAPPPDDDELSELRRAVTGRWGDRVSRVRALWDEHAPADARRAIQPTGEVKAECPLCAIPLSTGRLSGFELLSCARCGAC